VPTRGATVPARKRLMHNKMGLPLPGFEPAMVITIRPGQARADSAKAGRHRAGIRFRVVAADLRSVCLPGYSFKRLVAGPGNSVSDDLS
jgi:hypothetical protein